MPGTSKQTVSKAFGPKAADQLARLAIDISCRAPERIATYETRVPARMIGEVREILEQAGVDWRQLVRMEKERLREAETRIREERLREQTHH